MEIAAIVSEVWKSLSNSSVWVVAVLAAVSLGLSRGLADLISRSIRGKGAEEFRSFRIVFLGPPGVGKTTALLAALDQIGRIKQRGIVRMRGEHTIERLERARKMFIAGEFPNRTDVSESDVYRFDYRPVREDIPGRILNALFRPNSYRVELADFAGEHTQNLYESDGQPDPIVPEKYSMKADQNYLKWLSESDKCALFIDCESLSTGGEKYIGETTANYMAFWEKFLDVHGGSITDRSSNSVIVVFSKIDIFLETNKDAEYWEKVEALSQRFLPLIEFLKRNTKKVSVVGSSVIAREDDGEMAGVENLVQAMLPGYLN